MNKSLLALGAVCIGLIIAGAILEADAQKKVSSLKKIDPDDSFTLEINGCQIVDSSITSITKRTSTRDGGPNGSVRTEDYCEDSVYYTFVLNNAPSVNVTSRTSVTMRNFRQINFAMGTEPRDELCIANGNDLNPYDGFLSKDTPFVCEGLCAVGTIVNCWRPKENVCSSSVDDDCRDVLEWANCGNSQCLKLVDPSFELTLAIYNAGFPIGILLIVFGVMFGLFGMILYFFFCRKKNNDSQEQKFPSSEKV